MDFNGVWCAFDASGQSLNIGSDFMTDDAMGAQWGAPVCRTTFL